jgi:Fe-S-cluster containining protein
MIEGRYLDILAAVDAEFNRNRRLHGDRIHCRTGCTDCCHHLFQITEIEAAFVAKGIQRLDPETREALRARAREYLEERRKLLANGAREASSPLPTTGMRLTCPALDRGACVIYDFRPLMCHKFGMPLFNPDRPDRIFACELNFKDGEEIDDPQLVQIQTGIHEAWKQLQSDCDKVRRNRDSEPLTVARAILGTLPNEDLGIQGGA